MHNYQNDEKQLVHSLLTALRELPDSNAELAGFDVPAGTPQRFDAIIDVESGGRRLQLLVEAKSEAYPRDIRELIWQFYSPLAQQAPQNRGAMVPFIAARSISNGARDLLRSERIGYYDLGGSLFIPAKDFYVFIDRPPPKRARRIVSIFEGQKARTIMTLFAFGDEWVGVTELAKLANVSPATASATLGAMEQHDWVEAQGSGPSKVRSLRNRKALVDEWAAYVVQQKPAKAARYYVPTPTADDLCRKLDQACRSFDVLYAITGEAAAQLYSPYLSSISQVRCRIAPGRAEGRVLEQIEARPVAEGWNLEVIESKGSSDIIVGDEIDGIAVAPPLQVYLDLLQSGGRAKDMAAHLRAETLGL